MALETALDVAKTLANMSMQAWGFHITGALAVVGWAATTRSKGHSGISNVAAVSVSVVMFSFLLVTEFSANEFAERAESAMKTARAEILLQHISVQSEEPESTTETQILKKPDECEELKTKSEIEAPNYRYCGLLNALEARGDNGMGLFIRIVDLLAALIAGLLLSQWWRKEESPDAKKKQSGAIGS